MTTKNHEVYDMVLRDKAMMPVIAFGCAGVGKTYGAVGAAVEWMNKDKRKKVLVTRPNVSFAKESGFLPGSEREKIDPWVRPIQQNFNSHGVGKGEQECLEKSGQLSYLSLEFIQGLTFDDTFIIVDECQNMSFQQLKVFLTRVGKYSKVVLCGDIAQISPKFRDSGLAELIQMIDYFNLIVHTIEFGREDILRSEQCKAWIEAFDAWEGIDSAA
jgi:phosphate starvation-inducible PhoH-like protein